MKFHKKFHVVALLAAILAFNTQAAEVSSSAQVMNAVSAWSAANGSAFGNLGSSVDATAVRDADGTILYWIVKMSKGGAVIASADTNLDLVIAVLEKFDGAFPEGHPLPSILRTDMTNRLSIVRSASSTATGGGMSGYVASIASTSTQATSSSISTNLPEDVKVSIQKANSQWAKYSSVNGGMSLLAEELEDGDESNYVRRIVDGFGAGGRFTHWNQGGHSGAPLYNYYTTNHVVCGCVATAGAAIMQFFGCTNDIGEVRGEGCSYNGKSIDCTTVPGKIDWSIVPQTNSVDVTKQFVATNDVAREMFGRVTYNMGVLVGMGWGDSGSGAVTLRLAEVFKKYGFKTAARAGYGSEVDDKGASPYFKMIFAQNWAGAPVVMSIRSETGGHAVVACGYARDGDGDQFCRVFMGWGGGGDAWYNFPIVGGYNRITGVVTMIGHEQKAEVIDPPEGFASEIAIPSDSVVPICGRANVKNTTLVIPKGTFKVEIDSETMETNLVPVDLEVPVDENGFFGVRVPATMRNPMLVHPDSDCSMLLAPFNSKVLTSTNNPSRLTYEKAMPSELLFMVLNMSVASTVESARAIAQEEGKALLMTSGSGRVRDSMLLDYISYLDATSDISNKFVFVHINSSDDTAIMKDGDPSIGVFDPNDGEADLRWWKANGRLAYNNFLKYDNLDTNEVIYTFCATDALALTNGVNEVLDVGYDSYERINPGISVKISSRFVGSVGDDQIGEVSPAYGTHEKCWKEKEKIVFSATGLHTNLESGIVYSCVGWEVSNVDGVITNGVGNNVTLSFEKDAELDFVWEWKPTHYRVDALHHGIDLDPEEKAVTPTNVWIEAGGRVTLNAVNEFGDYRLWDWELKCARNGAVYGNDISTPDASIITNGNTISFFVYEPVKAYAIYDFGESRGEAVEYTVEIRSSLPELENLASLKHGYNWGENKTVDAIAIFETTAQSYVDSTGGVWSCKGWEINGKKYSGAVKQYKLSDSSETYSATCLWEFVPPAPDEETGGGEESPDEPITPTQPPQPVFTSISQDADMKWKLVLSNVAKGYLYQLEYTDSLSSANWILIDEVEGNESGVIEFKADANTIGDGRFWRVRVKEMDN